MTNAFKDEPQYSNTLTMKLPVATDHSHDLIRSALQEIRAIYRHEYRYKKAGVLLMRLMPLSQVQTDLFDGQNRVRSNRLMTALDAITVGGDLGPSNTRRAG